MKNVMEKNTVLENDYFPDFFSLKDYEIQSICNTCIHAEGCIYRGDGNRTIISCDDFDPVDGPVGTRKVKKKTSLKADHTNSQEYKGLCANCNHRHNCQYACSETGVWYCEEYK